MKKGTFSADGSRSPKSGKNADAGKATPRNPSTDKFKPKKPGNEGKGKSE